MNFIHNYTVEFAEIIMYMLQIMCQLRLFIVSRVYNMRICKEMVAEQSYKQSMYLLACMDNSVVQYLRTCIHSYVHCNNFLCKGNLASHLANQTN